MIPPLVQVPADAEEAALWWCAKRELRILSRRDEARFERWLEEPANAEAWDELNRPLEAFAEFGAMPEIRAMRASSLSLPGVPRAHFRRPWAAGAIAASLAAALIVGTTIIYDAPRLDPAGAARAVRYASGLGERRDVRLTDGSLVVLDTASTIEAAYSPGEREVRLLDGQARFDVAPNRKRPFVVVAGDRRITAVGTKFDVEVGSDGLVKVVLIKGRVKVEPARQSGLRRFLPGIAADELSPGEQLVSRDNGQVSIASADLGKETSWETGQLVFRDDRLAAAVAEMNRYSAQQIVLADPTIEDLKISGVFRTDRQQDFLAALTAFYPLVADRKSAAVIILNWRNADETTAPRKQL
jgi:transmembrane sensor